MNPLVKPPVNLEELRRRVLENVQVQLTDTNRLNYLESCINHGGDLANIAIEIKQKLNLCLSLDSSQL